VYVDLAVTSSQSLIAIRTVRECLIALRATKAHERPLCAGTHSVPRPDSSGRTGRASARVPMRHTRVRAPHSPRDLGIEGESDFSGSGYSPVKNPKPELRRIRHNTLRSDGTHPSRGPFRRFLP